MATKPSWTVRIGGGFIAIVVLAATGGALYKWAAPAPTPVAQTAIAISAATPPAIAAPASQPQNRWQAMGIKPIDPKPGLAKPVAPIDPKDVQDARALNLATLLKENANDPKSFELVKAVVTDAGGICLRIRARNGFGALMLQDLAVNKNNKSSTWAAACSPAQNPRDVTHIKYLL